MTNAERLLRELRQAGRRGCTHRELEGAGVAYISVEVKRLLERGAVIVEDRLPVSGQKRFVLVLEPDENREEAIQGDEPIALFDPPAPDPRSPYDLEVEDAA